MYVLKTLLCCMSVGFGLCQYTSDWESLDSRPLPQWYDDAKLGIFIHWGVFSVPSYLGEWFWEQWQGRQQEEAVTFMEENYPPGFTYQDFGPKFTAEFFDPDSWADLFNASGAQYVVLTSKHHEGFTLWPSKYSFSWNSKDVGPARDLVGDLANSIRTRTPHIHYGLYHSLFEWFNPLYLRDKNNSLTTNDFVAFKTMPELYEIVNTYQPDIVWSDGEWEAPDTYWNSTIFLAWLFNDSPVKDTVVVNDRWGSGSLCKHGSYYTCADRYNPGVLQPHKWENCMTLDKESWGFRREATFEDYMSIEEVIKALAETVSCGGNVLLNVGPTHDGRISPIMEGRLRNLGEWMGVNGEAIYNSRPWMHQNDSTTEGVWFTKRNSTVYAIILNWPQDDLLLLGSVTSAEVDTTASATLMGDLSLGELMTAMSPVGLEVTFPNMAVVTSKWAWVVILEGLKV